MTAGKDTIFERFLSPVFQLLIDQEALRKLYKSVDWQVASDRFRRPDIVYPNYYSSQNFHGIEGGYLSPRAAISYDPITQYALPPNETTVRQALIAAVQGQPRRILDLGCGTGSTTLLLKQAFPQAEVIGLDLSPYMLIMADMKVQQAGLTIQLRHGNAEQTGFPDASFDLVTASLLIHELPPYASRAVLQESYRLLTVGGEVAVLDGSQQTLRQVSWLNNIFEEPYINHYAAGSVDAWMGAAGFGVVKTQELWWMHQITHGVKPAKNQDPEAATVNLRSASVLADSSPDFGWQGTTA